ncbi:MAG: hypothetical protein Q8R92_01080 [Deltaproteobacteria bacterium]|nr:hypothetical protein [Deltaproteobacteria bacterium]
MTAIDLTIPTSLDRTNNLPAMVDRAARTLASAHNAAEVLEARDMASVAYDAAKRAARLMAAKGAFNELLAKVTRAQAEALEIEAAANRRIADEYDAAQERGEVTTAGGDRSKIPDGKLAGTQVIPPKQLHEARMIRDAEKASPGIVANTIKEAIDAGQEPTRAKVRRAVLRTVKPDAAPSRPTRGKAAIILRVREAIAALSGLPPAYEVIEYLRGTDDAVIVGERLPDAAKWLAAFADLWPEEDDNAENG